MTNEVYVPHIGNDGNPGKDGKDGDDGDSGAYAGIINLYGPTAPTRAAIEALGLDMASVKKDTYAICNHSNGNNSYRATADNPENDEWTEVTMVDTGMVRADAIKASQLEISSNSDGVSGRMFFGNNAISIYDNSGNLRVKLGALTNPWP